MYFKVDNCNIEYDIDNCFNDQYRTNYWNNEVCTDVYLNKIYIERVKKILNHFVSNGDNVLYFYARNSIVNELKDFQHKVLMEPLSHLNRITIEDFNIIIFGVGFPSKHHLLEILNKANSENTVFVLQIINHQHIKNQILRCKHIMNKNSIFEIYHEKYKKYHF